MAKPVVKNPLLKVHVRWDWQDVENGRHIGIWESLVVSNCDGHEAREGKCLSWLLGKLTVTQRRMHITSHKLV